MIFSLNIIIVALLLAEFALLGFNLIRRIQDRARTPWLTTAMIPMIVVTAIQLLPFDWELTKNINRDFLIWAGLIITAIAYGGMVLHDIIRDERLEEARKIWIGLSAIWLVGFLVTAMFTTPPFAGWSTWNDAFPTLPAVISILGSIAYSVFILGYAFYYFYVAPMPEVANRSAFWIVSIGIMLVAVGLLASGSTPLMLSATVILLAGLNRIQNYIAESLCHTL